MKDVVSPVPPEEVFVAICLIRSSDHSSFDHFVFIPNGSGAIGDPKVPRRRRVGELHTDMQ